MDIKNFTDVVRIGTWPICCDIQPSYDYGRSGLHFYLPTSADCKRDFQIVEIRSCDFYIGVFTYDRRVDFKLPPEWESSKLIWSNLEEKVK